LALWQIGNTTVRSPYRLRESLIVLKNSEFNGNLLGKERETGFAKFRTPDIGKKNVDNSRKHLTFRD
jgi:hypothetical protein